jgi:hypothetical protein
VRGYPARVILDFVQGLSLSVNSWFSTDYEQTIVRVVPSIEALQLALSYGVTYRRVSQSLVHFLSSVARGLLGIWRV